MLSRREDEKWKLSMKENEINIGINNYPICEIKHSRGRGREWCPMSDLQATIIVEIVKNVISTKKG